MSEIGSGLVSVHLVGLGKLGWVRFRYGDGLGLGLGLGSVTGL